MTSAVRAGRWRCCGGAAGPPPGLVLPAAGQRWPAAGDRADHGVLGHQRARLRGQRQRVRGRDRAGHVRRDRAAGVLVLPAAAGEDLPGAGAPLLLVAFLLQGLLDVLALLAQAKLIDQPRHRSDRRRGAVAVRSAGCRCSRPSWPSWRWWCGRPDVLARKGSGWAGGGSCCGRCSRWRGCCSCWSATRTSAPLLCMVVLFVGLLWAAGVRLRVFVAIGLLLLAGLVALMLTRAATGWSG